MILSGKETAGGTLAGDEKSAKNKKAAIERRDSGFSTGYSAETREGR
jgi:hypothetical protein